MRSAYVGWGALSADSRLAPDFLVIGGQRCGTTSIFRAFEQHPDIVRPTLNKGVNYFDMNYHRGTRWYRGHFPLARGIRRTRPEGTTVATFEASGYYMFHPLAPERIARDFPGIKIVAMLRDPVERAYSAWKHESARGFDDWSFERAIAEEAERTRGERERMIADPRYQSFNYRHHSYTARGDYSSQLEEYYRLFPAKNIHVVYSETFFSDPEAEFARLTDFLGVARAKDIQFDQHNARPSGPMPGTTREVLSEVYRGQAEQLTSLTGRRPPWGSLSSESES
ncbi:MULTISPECIES: sulfotransferase domain-containing protein [Bacteria]